MRKCKYCGKEFEEKTKNQCFCSNICRSRDYEKKRGKRSYEDVCDFCGKKITISRKRTKKENLRFCSQRCGDNYRREHNEKIKCKICGKEFIPYKISHLCCSRECKDKYFNLQKEYTCIICGKKYHTMGINSQTCSKECRAILTAKFLEDGKMPKSLTKPHKKVNEILEDLKIPYKNEKCFSKYSLDIFLIDKKIGIEIMGKYWHGDSRVYKKKDLPSSRLEAIEKDKRKRKVITEDYETPLLYLWEDDINKNPELCKDLILLFYNSPTTLSSYQSSSYSFYGNKLRYCKSYKKQYMEKHSLND